LLLLLLRLAAGADAMVMLRDISVAAKASAAGKGQVSKVKLTCRTTAQQAVYATCWCCHVLLPKDNLAAMFVKHVKARLQHAAVMKSACSLARST
jgi:hypothetical protein